MTSRVGLCSIKYIMHAYIRTYIHTHTYTYTHMYIRTYTYIHAHIHTYIGLIEGSLESEVMCPLSKLVWV